MFKYIDTTGVILPDTKDLHDEVVEEFRSVFGNNLVVDPETPQGALIAAEVRSRESTLRAQAHIANQIMNPNLAEGVFLDGIFAWMETGRRPASRSVLINVELTGVPGTVIPAGSRALTENRDEFVTLRTVILGNDGKAHVDFRAVEFGAIEVAPHALNRIAEGVLGWETVSNPQAATVGREAESDAAARNRRKRILAANTISTNEAIISRLYQLEGVHSLSYYENFDEVDHVVDGVTIQRKTIYVCIQGGVDIEIARAMKATKTVGAGYSGNELVEIIDEFSGQVYPVRFDRPEQINVYTRVTVRQSAGDVQSIVREAMQAFIDGEIEGEDGPTVGRSISPFEIAAAINFFDPSIYVKRVELSLDNATWSSNEQHIKINQIAYMPISFLSVVVE